MLRLLFLVLVSLNSFAATDIKNADLDVINGQYGFRNLVKNPSCKRGTEDITVSGTTVSRNTTSAVDGVSDCSTAATVISGTTTWDVNTLPEGLKGKNCEAIFLYTGGDANYTFAVKMDGTSIASKTLGQGTSINFPCGDGTKTITLEFTVGTTATKAFVYVGPATNLSNVAQAEAAVIMSSNASLAVAHNTDVKQTFGATLTTTLLKYFTHSSGTFTATASGYYDVTCGFALTYASSAAVQRHIRSTVYKNGAAVNVSGFVGGLAYSAFESKNPATQSKAMVSLNVGDTIECYAYQSNDSSTSYNTASQYIGVTRFPSAGELAVRNPILYYPVYSATVSSAGVVSKETSDWLSGNCSVANTSEYTCTVNSGVFPTTAPNCVISGFDTSTAAPIAKVFAAETTTSIVFKTYNDAASATAYAFRIECQAADPASAPSPLFVGSVTSDYSGAERIARFSGTCSSSASVSSSVSGTTIGNISSGCCTMTLPSGSYWSSYTNTACVTSEKNTASDSKMTLGDAASASTIVVCRSDASTTFPFNMLCMGPK